MSGIVKPLPGTPLNLAHPLAYGLVGCWLMNEGSGTLVHDYSGQGNTGTLTNINNPPIATSGWNAGPHGGALMLDGTNDYVNIPHNPRLNISSFPFTLAAWVNCTNVYENQGIISKGTGTWATKNYYLGLKSNSKPEVSFGDGTAINRVQGQSLVSANADTFLVAVFNNYDDIRIFLNAVESAIYWELAGATTLYNNSLALTLGSHDASAFTFNGRKDVDYIYNRALSADEIAYLYHDPYCMFLDRGLYEPWMRRRAATGMLSAAFTSKAPGVTWSN